MPAPKNEWNASFRADSYFRIYCSLPFVNFAKLSGTVAHRSPASAMMLLTYRYLVSIYFKMHFACRLQHIEYARYIIVPANDSSKIMSG